MHEIYCARSVLPLVLAAAAVGVGSERQLHLHPSRCCQPAFVPSALNRKARWADTAAVIASRPPFTCPAKLSGATRFKVLPLRQSRASTQEALYLNQTDVEALRVLACELKTDDGFAVAQFTRRSRPTWATEFLTMLSSNVLGRISQRLTWTMAWACYVTALITAGDYIAPGDWGSFTQFEVPGWPHELVGGFLSILLVFRTDQAYDRFWEGRSRWALLSSECNSLQRLVLTMPKPVADRFIATLALFPPALKQHLRGEKNLAELAALYRIYQPDTTALDAILQSKNIPMTILFTLSHLAAPFRQSGRGNGFGVMWEEVESRLEMLTRVVSECEKIKCTPIPLSYSRHTSRFFSLYTLSLPFALVKETSPLLVPTIVVVTSWVLFATEEIGRLIEDPFKAGSSLATSRFIAQEMSREDILREFQALDTDRDDLLQARDLLNLLTDPAGPFNVTAQQGESILRGLGLAGRRVDFEEFRLMWSFLAGGTRMKQSEVLPLEKFCDNINREMFFLWRLQDLQFQSTGPMPVGQMEDELEFVEDDEEPGAWSLGWTTVDVCRWLKAEGYGQYRKDFFDNDIDGKVLAALTTKDLGVIGVKSLGQRIRMLNKIARLVDTTNKNR